jgi:hypothetical protein
MIVKVSFAKIKFSAFVRKVYVFEPSNLMQLVLNGLYFPFIRSYSEDFLINKFWYYPCQSNSRNELKTAGLRRSGSKQ